LGNIAQGMEKFADFYEESMSRWEAEETKKARTQGKGCEDSCDTGVRRRGKQPWYKRVEKKVEPNAETLGDGNWPYDPRT
jgi:hypothetical protein